MGSTKGEFVAGVVRTSKKQLEEIIERVFKKQGSAAITPELMTSLRTHSPYSVKPPSSYMEIKTTPPPARGEIADLGTEIPIRVERQMGQEAYLKNPDAFGITPYGQRGDPIRRVRFATDEDPPENILAGKLIYEEEESQLINPQGEKKRQLLATPIAEIVGDANLGKFLWAKMAATQMGKAPQKTIGRDIWRPYYKAAKRHKKTTANNIEEYFVSNFMNWRKYPQTYRKNHPELADRLELLWNTMKPEGAK